MQPKIISITGTKGKTTTSYVVSEILRLLDENVLRVDTTGHYINGEQKSTLEDSKTVWGLVPSVAPGRYLWEFRSNPQLSKGGVAVLECSLGSSAPTMGLGYRYHTVGVFLNVFEDHLGSSTRIKTKEDIALAKDFIFSRINTHEHGIAVFNADDALVVDRLAVMPPHDATQLLPIGFEFSHFDLTSHLKSGGRAITVQNQTSLVMVSQDETIQLADLSRLPWVFEGRYLPSVWNVMAAVAAVVAVNNLRIPEGLSRAVESVRLDPYGGRVTVFSAGNGATVIADYAHEKESLQKIAELARSMVTNDGKVYGVVRLAHDRTDDLLQETGRIIADAYDSLIIYDKIDGHWRKSSGKKHLRFPDIEGRTSQVLADAIQQKNANVERIVREDEAIQRAAELVGPHDVVVVIVNDDIRRSIGFIKEYFTAEAR